MNLNKIFHLGYKIGYSFILKYCELVRTDVKGKKVGAGDLITTLYIFRDILLQTSSGQFAYTEFPPADGVCLFCC